MIDEKILRQIDEEALKQCGGDAAMWEHFRALLEGEFRIHSRGEEEWKGWVLARNLPQYGKVEGSVKQGWRKLLKNNLGISEEQQSDQYAINRALILTGCRRAKDQGESAQILRERAGSIGGFAANGDVSFFASLGRLLNQRPGSCSRAYDYAHAMLNNWLTSYLWLMPEKTAAEWLAGRCGQRGETAKELRHFRATKQDYGLIAHKPSLIFQIQSDGNLILTAEGRNVFRSLVVSKKTPGR